MARIVVPEAEELLEKEIKVLDRGFVRLVDYMGGDARVVQSARVSYGAGTKTVREDKGLINYLMRNQHTSPFEQVELVFHVKLPLFVFAQMVRHRTACLAGDSLLYFDLPGAKKRGGRQRHNMSIEKFYRLWHEGTSHPITKKKPLHLDRVDPDKVYTVRELANLVERSPENLRTYIAKGFLKATRQGIQNANQANSDIRVTGAAWHEWANSTQTARVDMRDRLRDMELRMCDERTGEIKATRVVDIWQTGVKAVYRVTLENGYSLKMTEDHRCLTENGWLTLKEASNLKRRPDHGVTWDGDAPALAVNGIPCYQDRNWLAEMRQAGLSVSEIADEAGVCYPTIRKWLKIHDLKFTPAERAKLSGAVQRGQKRPQIKPRNISEETKERIRLASSGERSHFWKGGVSTERENIGRWTTGNAHRVHQSNDFKCVICTAGSKLHAHHVDPVWHNEARAREFSNLTTLCTACHTAVHNRNLELDLLNWVEQGRDLRHFWEAHPDKKPRPTKKRLPASTKLVRTFSKIAKIEFVGHEMTYDLEVAGPFHNFVANGFIVHNSLNAMSARYSVMVDEFYLPEGSQLRAQSQTNKQVGEGDLPGDIATVTAEALQRLCEEAYKDYERMIEQGVSREQARMILPQNLYTQVYWKCDLHNLFHFLRLRLDWHAQQEIRVYAEAMAQCAKAVAPLCFEAFEEHLLKGQRFSRTELEAIRAMLKGEALPELSDRQKAEFEKKLWE
jgi:thymidylate synthase (FAD)